MTGRYVEGMIPATGEDEDAKLADTVAYDERRTLVAGRYENRNCSEMFYPKGVVRGQPFFDYGHMGALHFPPRAKGEKAVIACPLCRSSQPDVRRYKDEKIYCVSCLKKRWFDHRPAADGTARCRWADCPTDVIAIIATYVSDYPDYARLCMVGTRWLEGCNGDVWRESEMTKRVRWLLWKELYWRENNLPNYSDSLSCAFALRLEFASYAGEMVEVSTTAKRRLHLALQMVGSDYVFRHCGGVKTFVEARYAASDVAQCTETRLELRSREVAEVVEGRPNIIRVTGSGAEFEIDVSCGMIVKWPAVEATKQTKRCMVM